MNNKIIFTALLIMYLMNSCLNMNDPKSQESYINCRNSFDSVLVNHMPKKIPNNMISEGCSNLINTVEGNGYAGIDLTIQINNQKDYLETKKQFLKQAKYIKKSQDSCLLVIPTYGQLAKNYLDSTEMLLPIPQYAICESNDSTYDWQRQKNLDIIVLDYGLKDILKRKILKNRMDLPQGFSNGFSKGITTDDSKLTIQYWLIIW